MLSPTPCPPLPSDTARAAEAVFGREHPYLKIGESLERIWGDLELLAFGSSDALPGPAFYPYSLITILQSWEGLTDRQMAQATRTRLDIKYALHQPLDHPGFEPSILCEFRRKVLADQRTNEALQEMACLMSRITGKENPVVAADRMVASLCLLNRAEIILSCMEVALEAIASQDPSWLKSHALPHWYRRYSRKLEHEKIPRTAREIEILVQSIGDDGWHLLKEIESSNTAGLANLTEIEFLEQEWQGQFALAGGLLKFRESHCRKCTELSSINDTRKRKEEGNGHPMKAMTQTYRNEKN